MKYGFVLPGGNIETLLRSTREAEAAGWDAVFYWDGIYIEGAGEMYDPWCVMTAMAMQTQHIRIGAMLTPLSRRRPWKVARETTTLDHISHGRLIMPVGLGALDDGGFTRVHPEATERRARAELLDESLEILTGLWSGKPYQYQGQHYQLEEMHFMPMPIQQPRIPIWMVGAWPSHKSLNRAARYDGLLPAKVGSFERVSVDDLRSMLAYVAEQGTNMETYDVIVEGKTPGDDLASSASIVQPYAEAGATWWIEANWDQPDPEIIARRIQQGPPRI